jgi:hypothetical protein
MSGASSAYSVPAKARSPSASFAASSANTRDRSRFPSGQFKDREAARSRGLTFFEGY